jgi:hypothetical protein
MLERRASDTPAHRLHAQHVRGLAVAPRDAMRSILVFACLAFVAPVFADDDVIDVNDQRCAAYVPAELDESVRAWNQVLSFAACIQDSTVSRIGEDEDPSVTVAMLAHKLTPAIALYFATIQHGPSWVQVRAAYEIGLAHVALLTRARASLPSSTSPEQRERLEAAIARYGQTAWMVFAAIDRAARQDPAMASDPVSRYMVADARAKLDVLAEHAPTEVGTRDAPMDSEEQSQ